VNLPLQYWIVDRRQNNTIDSRIDIMTLLPHSDLPVSDEAITW